MDKTHQSARIFYPFLLPLFFVLHVVRYYIGGIPIYDTCRLSVLYVCFSAVLFLVCRLVIKNKLTTAVCTLLLLIIYFYWADIFNFAARQAGNVNYIIIPPLILVLSLVILLLTYGFHRLKPALKIKITGYLNWLFVIYIGVELLLTGFKYYNARHKPDFVKKTDISAAHPAIRPGQGNIYFLLFDEYAASGTLRHNWGFDNSGIEQFLTLKGFHISPGCRSNYTETLYSLASMLNLNYLDSATVAGKDQMRATYERCQVAVDDNLAMRLLEQAGYQVDCYAHFDMHGHPKMQVNEFNIGKGQLISNTTLGTSWENGYWPFIKYKYKKWRGERISDSSVYKINEYNEETIGKLYENLRQPATKLRFVYTHLLMPHFPFYYDHQDHLLPPEQVRDKNSVAGYCNNVTHANNKMKEIVTAIFQHDKNPTIFIAGDHGFRQTPLPAGGYKPFGTFNAIYYPDGDYGELMEKMSNVNLFRILLNKTCNTHFPMLEHKEQELP